MRVRCMAGDDLRRSGGRRSLLRRLLAPAAALMLLNALLAAVPTHGAVPSLDRIRVAIFINLPGKYQLTTPAATFSSETGIRIGARQPEGVVPILEAGAGEPVRVSMDGYRVRLLTTESGAAASALLQKLQSLSGSGAASVLALGGKTVYIVEEGAYPTREEAESALAKWRANEELKPLLGSSAPAVAGPVRLDAGSYGTLEEARKAAQALADAGLEAWPAAVVPERAKAAEFRVLVGAAADAAGLEALKAAGASLQSFKADEPYFLIRDGFEAGGGRSKHVLIPMDGSVKLWLEKKGDQAGIRLDERYGRSYRGAFEVTVFNQRLAVVNELPFEEYLYSVVGAEMPASWPMEALKAQAVAARSYALYQGFGFQIAHVVDSTYSQVYGGIGTEKPQTTAAVDATRGEVLMHNGRVVEALFSSSAGGMTADAAEIWGNPVPYLASVPSPDGLSEEGLYRWHRVVLPDGRNGYVREDLAEDTGERTAAGSKVLRITGDGVAIRPIPLIQSDVEPIARVNKGTRVVLLETVVQSNEMSWIRGPFTPAQLAASMNGRSSTPIGGEIRSLEVGARGPSGRVTELLVNGKRYDVRTPDTLRSALGGLPSTRFEIDETGRAAMLGASGRVRERPFDAGAVYMIGAAGDVVRLDRQNFYILNGDGVVRAATAEPAFRFIGTGNGHGVGLSQWGARGLAERGYDYQSILKYYYKNVTIEKEG
ncbi:SpoIID/LytB domain-containing protein [Thermobacillus sp. ZCTH02-B1]|uniref:SpoIID/LytB domain-containing protein n=1 Tax=Thermobacillus sp. ZCTH02-B1 TaxID=1858795 RepID=UPI0025E59C12|nr:SpoIID/LytB domain-containing protein [Thermobacillus sp. ZCTH02-B1]